MKRFQQFLLLIGIMTALAFAFGGEQRVVNKPIDSTNNTLLSDDSIHSSTFLQPQVTSVLSGNTLQADYTIAKLAETFLVSLTDFHAVSSSTLFNCQDPSRIEKIALLLYPFHFFW